MSTCISSHGEFSSHFPGPERFICGYCGSEDWDGVMAALEASEAKVDAVATLLDRWRQAVADTLPTTPAAEYAIVEASRTITRIAAALAVRGRLNRCRVCDRLIPRGNRLYCNRACRLRDKSARTYTQTQGRIDEITYLLEAGESPDQIATHLGLTLDAAAAWLYRHSHTNLANQFERAARRERRSA